jgi:CBS domain-containing protein
MIAEPAHAPHPQHEFVSLLTRRVDEAYVRKPFFVDGATDLVSVCAQMSAQGVSDALVRDGDRTGMFTTTDLRDALLRTPALATLPVRDVARFDLITVAPGAELAEALLLMVRHRVHRLVVRDVDGAITGVLNQLDLVGFFTSHSVIVGAQVDGAESVAELKLAARRVDQLVALLHGGGVKIELIAGLVSELNTRIFARAWSLVAPPELARAACLAVMGSEGRGEQILKTDQDNALLLPDGMNAGDAAVAGAARRLSAALAELGYPPCPGNVMVTNPLWRQPLGAFRETLRGWVYGHDADAAMNLAIFFDAAPVAGDAALLDRARDWLDTILAANDAFLARFARAADQFDEPGTWWQRLTTKRDEQPIDLKKLGTFPIVHGVRALALQHRVRALGTVARLDALSAAGRIDAALARDCTDALRFVMALKLTHQLRQRERGEPAGNLVRPSALGSLEREQLHDSIAIIKRFRVFLREHFRFDSL